MLARFARLAPVALTLGLLPGVAEASEPFVPSWIKNDPVAKSVAVEIIADENHLRDGQWIGLEVKDGLEQAMAIIHEDKFPPEDPPGRL